MATEEEAREFDRVNARQGYSPRVMGVMSHLVHFTVNEPGIESEVYLDHPSGPSMSVYLYGSPHGGTKIWYIGYKGRTVRLAVLEDPKSGRREWRDLPHTAITNFTRNLSRQGFGHETGRTIPFTNVTMSDAEALIAATRLLGQELGQTDHRFRPEGD